MLTGPSGELRKLADKLRELGRPGSPLRREASKVLGAAAVKLVQDGFQKEQDPYGAPWKPLRYRKGKILRDTGRGMRAYSAQPTPDGFRLSNSVEYMVYHQKGAFVPPHSRIGKQEILVNPKTGRIISASRSKRLKLVYVYESQHRTYAKGIIIPRRQQVPEESTGGIGPIWGAAFNREGEYLLRTFFGI